MSETELARMVVRLMGDATSYLGMLRTSATATQQVTHALEVQSMKIQGYYQNVIGFGNQIKFSLLSALGVVGTFATGLNAIQRSAQAEDLRMAFGTMLQDMKAGAVLMERIQKFAAETPLETNQLAQVTKMLLQANAVAPSELIETLRMLGDAAGGNAEKLQGLAYAFGQVKTFGRLMGGELMQLRNAGFDPIAEIARTTGKSSAELLKMQEQGLISFEMVRNALKTATAEGGRFFDGMKNGSKTLNGVWSTIKDNIGLTLQAIGDSIVEAFDLKNVILNMSAATQDFSKWAKIIGNGFIFVRNQTIELIKANSELIINVLKVIGVLAGLWATYKAGLLVIGMVIFALKVLKVDLILNTALWVAWKIVVLAWTAAIAVATGVMTAFKLVVWLVNAALTVMDILLVPAGVVAFAAAVAVAIPLVTGLSVAAGTAYAAFQGMIAAGSGVIGIFKELGNSASGPMNQITGMLKDWNSLVTDLSKAVQQDFALAWDFVKAYAMLAFEQVKAIWPPTLQYLRAVADVIWNEMKSQFVIAFGKGMNEAYEMAVRTAKEIGRVMILSTTPLGLAILQDEREMKRRGEQAAKAINEGMAQNAGKAWQMQIKEAADQFNKALQNMDQEGIKNANERLAKLRQQSAIRDGFKQIRDAGKDTADALGKSGEAAASGIKPIEKAAHNAHQAIQKLQGTLVGSNEGYARLLEQRDLLEGRNIGRNAIDMKTGRIILKQDKVEKLLGQVAANTDKIANNNAAPPIQPANI